MNCFWAHMRSRDCVPSFFCLVLWDSHSENHCHVVLFYVQFEKPLKFQAYDFHNPVSDKELLSKSEYNVYEDFSLRKHFWHLKTIVSVTKNNTDMC